MATHREMLRSSRVYILEHDIKMLKARCATLEEALKFILEKCQLYGPHDQARELARKALSGGSHE